jgi:tRNA A-37 threonylcarbamoyl transferase component Bud32
VTYRESPPDLFGCPIVVRIAQSGHETADIQREYNIYRQILGKGIGPKFLAHITEDGRMIGFILKKIEGTKRPRPDHFKECKRALEKFHKLGYLHQDCHHSNVLVKKGRAILVDFRSAKRITSEIGVEGKRQDLATLRAACGISS